MYFSNAVLTVNKYRISITSTVDPSKPEIQAQIRALIDDCMRAFDFPRDVREGSIDLAGVERFFTCAVDGGLVEMYLTPRDTAERLLNEYGLTTDEPFNPLRRRVRGGTT